MEGQEKTGPAPSEVSRAFRCGNPSAKLTFAHFPTDSRLSCFCSSHRREADRRCTVLVRRVEAKSVSPLICALSHRS